MYQGGRLEGMVGSLPSHLPFGDPVEFGVNEWDEVFSGGFAAGR